MGQKFCTVCGAKLSEGIRFCESCGAPVEPAPVTSASSLPGIMNPAPAAGPESLHAPAAAAGKFPTRIIAGIAIVLIIAAAGFFLVLPKLQDDSLATITGQATPVPTLIPTPVATPSTITTTLAPTPTQNPFPNAIALREIFSYNEGKYASRATVYRYWMNDTYQWHSDADNRFYTQRPKAGNKYLLVFVNIENIGSDGYPYPTSHMIVVHNGGNRYNVDTSHYLPDKSGNRKATPIEIQEIEQQSDYFNLERVEDYGYSHGTTQDFVLPGQGNAIDGYLIYEVPASLTPDTTYIEIVFDGQDRAAWKLA
jgi:hypothetical protein